MNADIQEIQIACFCLGEDLYAVDIMRIKEIIRPQRLANLPKAPAFVEGIFNLRGVVVPVVDLRKRFDLSGREIDQKTRLLIVKLARQSIGLIVDDVTEVITVPLRDIKPPPQVVRGVGAEYFIGVCLVKDAMIMLLNVDRLLSDREVAELDRISSDRLE